MYSTKVKTPIIMLLVACLAAGALVALAADPQQVAPDNSGKAASAQDTETRTGRSSVSELKVNQAELQGSGELLFDTEQLPLKPMTLEIDAVLEDARLQVSVLQASFDKEHDSTVALELVRQIEQIKGNAELEVLRVQVRHARANGNEELARKIEADLTLMTTPRPRKQPLERPAADAGRR